jgi:4-amino-4-deoxychorismate lyase
VTPPAGPLAVGVLGRGLVDPEEPVIHVDDLGFLRGMAVFETLRVYAGRPFALREHLERLGASARRLGLAAPDAGELGALVALVVAAAAPDCSLRFTLTAGREGRGAPLLIVTAQGLPPDLEAVRARGIRLVSLQLGIDPRSRRDAPWLLDGVKSTSYAVNMAAWAEARRRGADDAVFVAADGSLLEGPVTNVWWRRGRVLHTPTLDLGILAGVTRARLLRAAPAEGYRVEEGRYPVAHLAAADEAFTSSSVREVVPVVALDDGPVGDGRPGPAAAVLQAAIRRAAARQDARDPRGQARGSD